MRRTSRLIVVLDHGRELPLVAASRPRRPLGERDRDRDRDMPLVLGSDDVQIDAFAAGVSTKIGIQVLFMLMRSRQAASWRQA